MKKIGTVAGASIAAFAVGATVAGGIAIASADDNGSAATGGAQQQYGMGMGMGMNRDRGPGELVTGEDAQAAMDAALKEVPGTADHVHKTSAGTYLVMVTTSDNKRIVVTLNANFAVTGQLEVTGRGPGHGPGTPATADEKAKATDAALAKVTGATVLEVFKRDEGGFAVMLRTDAGAKKVVLLDATYEVTSVETPPRRGRGHHPQIGRDVTGASFKKAEAAALAEVDGTVMDVHKVANKYWAMVRKDNGTMVVVKMNSDFTVTGTKKFTMRMHHGPMQPSATSAA